MVCGFVLLITARSIPVFRTSIAADRFRGIPKVAMLDHFEIINLLQSSIHHWKGLLLRYIMISVVCLYVN